MISLKNIKRIVESHFQIRLEDRERTKPYPSAKYCYFQLAMKYAPKKSLYEIAGFIGYDHSTIIYYRDRYDGRRDSEHLSTLNEIIKKRITDSPYDMIEENEKDLIKRIELLIESNQNLRDEVMDLKEKHEHQMLEIATREMPENQKELNKIFLQLPERTQKDLLFKAQVALKMNNKEAA